MLARLSTLLAFALLVALAPAAAAHKGNPNYSSEISSVTPQIEGVAVQVLNRDDRLEMRSQADRVVVIEGYNGEPYARIKPDGTVEVNTRSPAYYLNDDRYGQGALPPQADENARPEWKKETGNGRFEWHDHRMHWMNKSKPEQVEDEDVRTKVFDWKVPLRYGNEKGAIAGTLFWVPSDDGGPPLGAVIGFGGVLLASGLLVFFVRRRRRGNEKPAAEAW
jgi:hypothetical protein